MYNGRVANLYKGVFINFVVECILYLIPNTDILCSDIGANDFMSYEAGIRMSQHVGGDV